MLSICINYIGCPKHPDFISCLIFYALRKNLHAIVCIFFAKQWSMPHTLLIISNILYALFLLPGGICHALATIIAQSIVFLKSACFRNNLKSKTRNSWKRSHPKLVSSNQIVWNESVRRGYAFWSALLSLPYEATWKDNNEWAPLLFPTENLEKWIK